MIKFNSQEEADKYYVPQILKKLLAEGLNINSPWDKIKHCLQQTVAPDFCIETAKRLRYGGIENE